MLSKIIHLSIKNKLIVFLGTLFLIGFGLYSVTQISIGAVPDITNNQVQVITTSNNLSTQDMEQFITYPIELEMANLPDVEEIRSVSKFGLSVVTIVFKERMGSYLPRQLIAEKIEAAKEKIPEGFGSPEMGPITTGLGEIYQYILDVEPEYKDNYSTTDLRTIQDWIVKRQLSGISGVVEVNTWGGMLKQYEVAINTAKLNAMNIKAQEVFEALEKNNSVAGGGYIEKVNQAYFIRGEGLVNTISDIENIVVKNQNGLPIYIKDIAKVGYGSANRFGAITANGEGEKVFGQIMMLKGANSNQVIKDVKQRVQEVSKSLPEGVYIKPILERSELVGKTMFTVSENLILGCLIVIFVVVLLLGNFRSGLVVASVIPLCLLFALSMMYLFEIDANLMSLGAIDFGIIIDGAVIIVEFISFQMVQKHREINALPISERQSLKDNITFKGASKMMNSAVFGQLIILIVFIPILSLQGVEGKMFKPMAMVFSFALIGAMILCFTYVPAMSSWFLKSAQLSDKNISVRLMNFVKKIYSPSIDWAMAHKKTVLGVSAILLIFSGWIYSRMGSEFVPTLDEGDFVIQPVLKTGTSLSKTIEISLQIEKIIKDNFPEVKDVVSRIGAAEIPTDPMNMEQTDVMITLKPKKEWTSAKTKDELADKIKEALSIIPGMEVEFTQPIEMRFNELISGVRSDIAVKIYGEDLDILAKKGNEIKELIENVNGVADISVEKVAGLPQMNVKYNRTKIARYGLNISDVNDMLSMAFAGRTTGQVFEGEKRFDLVVRLDKSLRKDISDIKNLFIDLPSGGKIPMSELAEISYQKGAAQISRDNTQRRINVGVNVRNRDLQSVVDDIQKIIDKKANLPVGYYIKYGGQFENLERASKRLMIAVPVALLLIFILLYFAFHSVKEALIIYSAIPFATIGGILLLWIRDLPFSISAGVGFIALFGIAVLNGIVLIEHFKELQHTEDEDFETMIKHGAKDRLRAVLLTATAAALGFLPMAISTGAGAEVQRPLATVVIGGLVTSTMLTLIVLPILYTIFKQKKYKFRLSKKGVVAIALLTFTWGMNAQQKPLSLEELTSLAVKNNAAFKAQKLKVAQAKALRSTAFNFDKTEVYYARDENNIGENGVPLNTIGVQQTFAFPTVYFANRKVKNAQWILQNKQFEIAKKKLQKEVASAYYQYQIQREKKRIYQSIDSLYSQFSKIAKRKFELGESNYLEKITASAKQKQINLQLTKAENETEIAYKHLTGLVQSKDTLIIISEPFHKVSLQKIDVDTSAEMLFYQQRENWYKAKNAYEKQQLLPDVNVTYFQSANTGLKNTFQGYQIGVKIPLLFSGQISKIKASKIDKEIAQEETNNYKIELTTQYQELLNTLKNNEKALMHYETEGNTLADEILKTANSSYKHGEIDFFQYIQSLENAYHLKIDYLNQLKNYNQTIININYLTL